MSCPCGTGRDTGDCCGPLLERARKPETAEALMRARYSAYVLGNIDFVVDTHDPDTRDEVDRDAARKWSESAEWLGLEVLATRDGGPGDERGEVEFVARYRADGAETAHHERAEFARKGGDWFYITGEMVKGRPVVRQTPRVGRNEPCPCGSGRKYKKCHGAAA